MVYLYDAHRSRNLDRAGWLFSRGPVRARGFNQKVLILNALILSHYQACLRRHALEQLWNVIKIRPHSLFDSCLREGALRLSTGEPAEKVRSEMSTKFVSRATQPGLDLPEGSDSYTIAMDWAGMLSVILTAIAETTQLTLLRLAEKAFDDFEWQPFAFADESGVLHRWLTVDAWDQAEISRQLHSWYTAGDMAIMDSPMVLHVVLIGQVRKGRRWSPWARAYRDPLIANRFRFQRKDKTTGQVRSLAGEWKPFWYQDQPSPDPDVWLELMKKDGVLEGLIQQANLKEFSKSVRRDTLAQIKELAREMDGMDIRDDPMDYPMSRGSCDSMVPCPFQGACFRENPREKLSDLGLYSERSLVPRSKMLPDIDVASLPDRVFPSLYRG